MYVLQDCAALAVQGSGFARVTGVLRVILLCSVTHYSHLH